MLTAVQPELAVIARLEWLPGRDAHRVWMTLLTPEAVYTLPGGQAILRGDAEQRWRAGGLVFDCIEPLKTWTVRFRGALERRDARGRPRELVGGRPEVREASVDLTFLAALPPFVPGSDDDPDLLARQLGAAEWDARLIRQLRRRTLRGYVQAGDVHGSIALGSELLAFGGAGLRVHTWGVRDWGASDEALQCFLALGQTRTYVHTARFPWVTLSGGFVRRPGGVVALRDLGVTPERRPGRAPARIGLAIEAPGGPLDVETETIAELPLDIDGRGHLDSALVRARAGDQTGWGLCFTQSRILPRPAVKSG